MEELTRFWSKVNKIGGYPDFTDPLIRVNKNDGECWIWLGAKSLGYGNFYAYGKYWKSHRFSYSLVHELTHGFQIDHLCRNPACVNPLHLEEVTIAENVARGSSPTVENARKTECPSGHGYDLLNTAYHRGKRRCRECDRIRHAKKYQEKKNNPTRQYVRDAF